MRRASFGVGERCLAILLDREQSKDGGSQDCSFLHARYAASSIVESDLTSILGNAATPVHRLPLFSKLLLPSSPIDLIFAPAPRSYWTSTHPLFRGPTEQNLVTDYLAAFHHLRSTQSNARVYLHAHSIGCGILLQLLLRHPDIGQQVEGIILEAPMTSLADMLAVMYPHKLLPYRYLSPFLFDRYDSLEALTTLGSRAEMKRLKMLFVVLEKDELVPREMTKRFFEHARASGLDVVEVQIGGALHDTGYLQASWVKATKTSVTC